MTSVNTEKAAAIIRDAGGTVIGRTRLQKIAYLLTEVGLEDGFDFVYKHYGPYSDTLASAAKTGSLLGRLDETEKQAEWGGIYSIYSVSNRSNDDIPESRKALARMAAHADAVELELAATAIFLFKDGYSKPWAETERRKPEKAADGRLQRAKQLLHSFRKVAVPRPLPEIA